MRTLSAILGIAAIVPFTIAARVEAPLVLRFR